METGSKDYSRILSRYQKSLEELTFNSKPLIDDLTRTAGANNVIADQIVELIKKHIMKVASWRWMNFWSHLVLLAVAFYFFILIFEIFVYSFLFCINALKRKKQTKKKNEMCQSCQH